MKLTRQQLTSLIRTTILSEVLGPSDKELLDLSNEVKTDVLKYIDSPDLGTKTWKARIDKKINNIDPKSPRASDKKIKFLRSLQPTSEDTIKKIKQEIWNIKPGMANSEETAFLLRHSADAAYMPSTNRMILNPITYGAGISSESLEDTLYHEFFHALDYALGRVFPGKDGAVRAVTAFFEEDYNKIIDMEINNNPDRWRQKMKNMGASKLFLVGYTDALIKGEFHKALAGNHAIVNLQNLRREFGSENPIAKACNLTFDQWRELDDDLGMFVSMLKCTPESIEAEDRIAVLNLKQGSYA